MIKFRLYYDKDKETLWLNEMADQGYAMTGFFAGFYTFEKCEPGEYRYQVDFSEKLFALGTDYREFMKEMNIEIVQQWFFWIILRKTASEGEFQLYTDIDSSIAHYKKIRTLFKAAAIFEMILFIIECICATNINGFWPVACAILLAIIIFFMIREVTTINKIIDKLKERKGEPSDRCKNSKASPLLASGLLLNSCIILIDDGISSYIKYSLQIVAIILMLIGIYQTRHIFYQD